jgi:monoamine oxidase
MHSGEGGRATHVIIIGAGLAGLRCGSQLLESGTVRPDQVTILEAREAIGGRLLQDGEFVTGREVELGAELIHGNCNSLTQLADEEGWPICPVFTWAHGDGGPCPSTSGQGHGLYYIARQRRMLRWDAEDEDFVHLNESLRELCEDVVDESDISLMDWLSLKRFSKDMIALAAAGYANTCGGPAESIGLNGLRRWEVGWEDEGEGDAVLGGGGSRLLVERAARGLAGCIKTQWPVKSVQYCPSGAEVIGENGESLRCSHVVVAVPLTTIQRGLVSFEPPLPRKMIEASQQYGMGRYGLLYFSPFALLSPHLSGTILQDSKVVYEIFKSLVRQRPAWIDHDWLHARVLVQVGLTDPLS